jgi:hypothetical protein
MRKSTKNGLYSLLKVMLSYMRQPWGAGVNIERPVFRMVEVMIAKNGKLPETCVLGLND